MKESATWKRRLFSLKLIFVYLLLLRIVGCAAVVTHDIPDNVVVAGIPARVIESIDEYYQKSKMRCDNTKHMSVEEKRRYYMKKMKLEKNDVK